MYGKTFSIDIDMSELKKIEDRYGEEHVQKAIRITKNYTNRISAESKNILSSKGHVDTGKTIQSIKPDVGIEGKGIVGEVNANTKYARFLHEGTKHEGDTKLVPHFVPFKVAPSLRQWAIRNKVIYQKTKNKKKRWYMKGKNQKEYSVNIEKGGLCVNQEATKYFEIPFEKLAPEYVKRIEEIL